MITSYSDLQDTIGDWLNRADLTSVIPTFIQLCEAQIQRRIRTKFKDTLAITLTDANEGVETIPGDSPNEIVSMYITSPSDKQGELDPVSPQKLWEHRRATRHRAGRPTVVAIIDQQLYVSRKPDQDYESELVIEGPLVVLSDSNPSNYVLAYAPDVYLFGSLVMSAPYLKEDPRLSVWKIQFEEALTQLEAERERNEYPNTLVQSVPKAYGPYEDYR